MKIIFATLVTLVFSIGHSAERVLVDGVSIQNCNFWTTLRDANGATGYACSGYPARENVAEFYSTDRALRDAEKKISDLTRRVEALEKKLSAAD